jgi:protein-S-isoprenylcysteine O-methyltransferase Ste14
VLKPRNEIGNWHPFYCQMGKSLSWVGITVVKKAGRLILTIGLTLLLLSGIAGSISVAAAQEPADDAITPNQKEDGEHQLHKYIIQDESLSNPESANQPPFINSVTVDPCELWPPDNKAKDVTITVTASDPDGPGDITGITYSVADEYGEYTVRETPLPEDGVITLLAKRQDDDKDGRIYLVMVTAYDAHNLSDSVGIEIIVPYEMDGGNALTLMAGIFTGPGLIALILLLFNRGAVMRLFSMSPIRVKYDLKGKIVYFLCILLLVVLAIYTVFLPLKLGTAALYAGLSIYAVGLIIAALVIVNRARAKGVEPPTRGLHRYSRHPMYLAAFITLLGICMATASWICLALSVALIILVHLNVLSEEHYWLKKYGNSYLEYMNRVPRWIGIQKSGNS